MKNTEKHFIKENITQTNSVVPHRRETVRRGKQDFFFSQVYGDQLKMDFKKNVYLSSILIKNKLPYFPFMKDNKLSINSLS